MAALSVMADEIVIMFVTWLNPFGSMSLAKELGVIKTPGVEKLLLISYLQVKSRG